jgi:hypothetical protein
MKIIYTADFIYPEVVGGGELNDDVLCSQLNILLPDISIEKINCYKIDIEFLRKNKDAKFIISNFISLDNNIKNEITNNFEYVIYEHDHKYLQHRNPGIYKDFLAPKNDIINFEFYKNAKQIFCQSSFHKKITKNNLGLENIYNNSGNLWDIKTLEKISELSNQNKIDRYSIMYSNTPHKNTESAIKYCKLKGYDFEIIESAVYEDFLVKLSRNKKLIFLPLTPETLSRIVVEARMMGIETITNKNIGASYEPWIELKGDKLISVMKQKLNDIPMKVWEKLNE